jgi:UPF0755 protein
MKLPPLYRHLILSAIGVLLIGIAGTGFWIRRQINNQHAHGAAGRVISIEPRSSTAAIIAQLHREGILAREFPAELYLRFFARKRSLKAGDYEFKSPISPREAIEKLLRGEVATRFFTIPEGYNQFEIARVLFGVSGLKQPAPATPEELLPLFKNTALIADLDPHAESLEGYLFPATYEYTASTTREAMVEAMVKHFRRVFTPTMRQQASEMGMDVRQAVTMASLIEEEAKVDAERELISSVFHRRLKLGVQLACDPTLIYAALLAGKYRGTIYRSDLDRDSPYNTYRHAGLPPGPIASPGRRSLEAAVKPAETDYLYFVVDATRSDGAHKFSASSADHERAVALLRRQEQERKTQSK